MVSFSFLATFFHYVFPTFRLCLFQFLREIERDVLFLFSPLKNRQYEQDGDKADKAVLPTYIRDDFR